MPPNWLRRLIPLELLLIRHTSFLQRAPVLRRLHRQITARLTLFDGDGESPPAFRVDFETPYLHLPLEADRSQIGRKDADSGFRPEAFRFFDWQSWGHIDGEIEWHGEREVALNGERATLIGGFSYKPGDPPQGVGNLGLRIAEGVEGTLRILSGNAIVQMQFAPGYWLLEPGRNGYRTVLIRDTKLMVLIVSLSEIGTGNRETYDRAIEHLLQWVSFRWGGEEPKIAMFLLLQQVRDWGPLGMASLYEGLVQILNRMGAEETERVLFDFYADHWGIRDNKKGRLLAIRALEALGTESARSALLEILNYVRNRGLSPEELVMIRTAAGSIGQPTEEHPVAPAPSPSLPLATPTAQGG